MEVYKLKTNKTYPYDKEKYIDDRDFHSSLFQDKHRIIHVNYEQGQALIRMFDHQYEVGHDLPLGTRDASNVLMNTNINVYSVDQYPTLFDNSTLFWMRRDGCGAWHARYEKLRDVDLILGPSELISFELLKNAASFLCKTAHTRKKENSEAESLATFVGNFLYYPL